MRARRFGTLIGLILLCAVLWALTPHFLTVSNLLNVAQQTSINAIVAVGMTFVIISGGIDLSVGSIVALSGVALGLALQADHPVMVAVLLALAVGLACGQVNGLLIDRGGLPPFIVTLGTMSMARGAALVVTEGRPVSGFDADFRALATGTIAFVPAPISAMVLVYVVAHLVLTRTTLAATSTPLAATKKRHASQACGFTCINRRFTRCRVLRARWLPSFSRPD
jgi:ribose transport system permease protein